MKTDINFDALPASDRDRQTNTPPTAKKSCDCYIAERTKNESIKTSRKATETQRGGGTLNTRLDTVPTRDRLP